jgi:hypothetical protein
VPIEQCANEVMCQFKMYSIINPTVIASKAKLSAQNYKPSFFKAPFFYKT